MNTLLALALLIFKLIQLRAGNLAHHTNTYVECVIAKNKEMITNLFWSQVVDELQWLA